MKKILRCFASALFFIALSTFVCAKDSGINASNIVFLKNEGTQVVLKVKIMQIAKKGCFLICDVSGKKLYAISDASRMCVGSGVVDNNGVLEIIYNNPFRKKDKDLVYVERLYFIMQTGDEIIGYAAPDPSHPCFVGQYNYKFDPPLIDRNEPFNPEKLSISFVLPYCYANTAVNPTPNGVPWTCLGPQKKSKIDAFVQSYVDLK
ncbi:MAG: hypothetical protein V1891_00745 [bacterium]